VPTIAQAATTDKEMLMLQRLASLQATSPVEVFVGKAPSAMPEVPLPSAEIIGSVKTKDSAQLLYIGSPDIVEKYRKQLTDRGWKASDFPPGTGGGFAGNSGPQNLVYCKAGTEQVIGVWFSGPSSDDLRVSVATGENWKGSCSAADMVLQAMAQTRTPLPDLQAPSGAEMISSQAGNPSGRSGAYIKGATSMSAVLASFASQMTAAGWNAGARTASDSIASQSFSIVDDKKTTWQCMLTVYAVDGKPKDYLAFVDVTNLTSLK
jgi:hypothetical protein